MFLDSKTEIIAHFVGIFQKVVEAARMRSDYEEFTAAKAEVPDAGALLTVKINVTSPFVEDGFSPDLPYFLSAYGASGRLPDLPLELQPKLQEAAGQVFLAEPVLTFALPNFAAVPVMVLKFLIPPPSSAVTINIQNAYLWDEDFLSTADLGVEFTPLSVFHSALQALSSNAGGLQVLEVPPPPAEGAAIALMSEVIGAQVFDTEAPGQGGDAVIYFAKGGEAHGIAENGAPADVLSVFADMKPAAMQDEDSEEEETEETEVSEVLVLSGDEAAEAGDSGPQHELNTGTNLMANEAHVHVSWLDAPVITVMGDYLSVDVVSQINVYNDMDHFQGGYQPQEASGSTVALNAASITSEANPITGPEEEPAEEGEAEDQPGPGPSYVAVTRIDGDVVNMNYTIQYAFAYDNDVASVQFHARETYIEMGGNSVFNLAALYELGFYYDLIVVGGSMYDVTMVVQTNILLDSDFLHLEAGFEGEVSTSDNLLMNRAELTTSGIDTVEVATEEHEAAASMLEAGDDNVPGGLKSEEVFEDIEVLRVLYISGDLIDLQVVQQTNVLGDADQVAAAMDTVRCNAGADVELTTGSNALLNNARLADNGIDSTVYAGGEGYTDALLYQADLVDFGNPLDGLNGAVTDLASEAVVFLAEGMTGDTETGPEDAVPMPDYGEAPADVMQSILA